MDDFHCSFCGKRRREVRKLISGPRVFICDECVALCNDIIAKEEAAERHHSAGCRQTDGVAARLGSRRSLDRTDLCGFHQWG